PRHALGTHAQPVAAPGCRNRRSGLRRRAQSRDCKLTCQLLDWRSPRVRRPRERARSVPMKLREKAYQSFTRHLLAMDIRPGQFITQREMVALTGLTLGAIREMIPRLEALGLLVTVPQRGMQIAHVDLKLVRNAFQFRGILEREAVAAFTRRASADDVAALAE